MPADMAGYRFDHAGPRGALEIKDDAFVAIALVRTGDSPGAA